MGIGSKLRYASTTMVTARLNGRTPLSTQQMEEIIEQCEQYVDTLMKIDSASFTFDGNKHLIIRDAVVNRAALIIANAEPLSLQTLEQASTQMNVLRDALVGDIDLLSTQDIVLFLRGR